jgi:hypothetical protein
MYTAAEGVRRHSEESALRARGVRVMDADKRKALEEAGWRFGDAADFLAMGDEERQRLDARMEAAQVLQRQRESRELSQEQVERS